MADRTTNEDLFYTTREAAELLNVSVKTAQLWAESGALRAWKTPGGHRRITRESVDALVAQRASVLKKAKVIPPVRVPLHDLLVVEDDSRTRRLYEMTLEHWGLPLNVTLARDGFEALLKVGARAPDTLLTDLNMPGMDGFRLIAALRLDPRFRSTQIIVISGMPAAEIKANGGLPKGITVLPKPIPFGDLRKLIEHRLVG